MVTNCLKQTQFPRLSMSVPSRFCVTASIYGMTSTEAYSELSRTSTMAFFVCVLDKPLLKAFNINVVITKPCSHTSVAFEKMMLDDISMYQDAAQIVVFPRSMFPVFQCFM